MTPNELLLFKQYDSHSTLHRKYAGSGSDTSVATDVNDNVDFTTTNPNPAPEESYVSCFVPHSSFYEELHDDVEYPGRESIETGILVLFE